MNDSHRKGKSSHPVLAESKHAHSTAKAVEDGRSFQFLVTLTSVSQSTNRNILRDTIINLLGDLEGQAHAKVVRYNPNAAYKKGRLMQRAAADLLAKVIDPTKAMEILSDAMRGESENTDE